MTNEIRAFSVICILYLSMWLLFLKTTGWRGGGTWFFLIVGVLLTIITIQRHRELKNELPEMRIVRR